MKIRREHETLPHSNAACHQLTLLTGGKIHACVWRFKVALYWNSPGFSKKKMSYSFLTEWYMIFCLRLYNDRLAWESAEVKATDSCMSVVFSRCRSTNVFSVHNAGGGLSTQWQVCKIDVRSHHPGLHIQLFSRFQMCNNTMLEKEQGKRNCRLVHCYEAGSQTRMPQLYCVLLEQNINSCKCSPLRN